MKPVLCNYYVTLRCNSRCNFCNIWKTKKNFKLKEQSRTDIDNNLRDLKKLGVRFIDFTGGEPLLYHNLIYALEQAKKWKFFTTLTTNTSLYLKYGLKMKGLVDHLQFSFDSADETKHNTIRGIDSYKDVIKSISFAKKIKQKLYLIHTVTNENIDDVPSIIKFVQKNKNVVFLNLCFGYFGNKGLSKNTARKLKTYFKEPNVMLNLANLKLIERGGNDIKNPICRAVSSCIVISPDNYLLLPCYHHFIEKIKIDDNLYNIYNSDKIKKFMKHEGRFSFCKNCVISCYMKVSLYRNKEYWYDTLKFGYKFLREKMRRQF